MNAFRMGARKKICLSKFAVSTSRQGYWYGVIWRVDSDQRLIIKHSFALFVGLCVKCLNSNFWKKLDLEILQVANLSNFASAKQKWHDQNVSQFAVYRSIEPTVLPTLVEVFLHEIPSENATSENMCHGHTLDHSTHHLFTASNGPLWFAHCTNINTLSRQTFIQ